MKRRFLCFLLSVFILFGAAFGAAPQASAAEGLKTSEKGIALIKLLEGFSSKPYQDNGQWSVGYGSAVSGSDLTKYQTNGITASQADALLREYVEEFEEDLNAFAAKYGLTFSQNQFDALISFTYNLGPNWMNNDSAFRQAVIERKTGNDLIFAITRWCTADSVVVKSLIDRRLIEANVYLNGDYTKAVPSNYRYVIFDDNISKPVANDVRVQGYDASLTDTLRSTPSKTGCRFLGWYTEAEGGAWVSTLNSSVTATTLYAHWQVGGGDTDENGNYTGTAAEYTRTMTESASKIVREAPSDSAEETARLNTGDTVTIVADYMDSNGAKWGKLSTGGWINLHASASTDEPLAEAMEPVTVHVLNTGVNIRSGPGTSYDSLGKFTKGQELVITAVLEGGQYLWGKASTGWICLKYTDYDLIVTENSEDASVVTAVGTVIRTDELNIRSGPGTSYGAVGKYYKGDVVKITLQQKNGSSTWGLTEKGWVCLYYLQLSSPEETETTTPEETTPETTEPSETPETSGEAVIATGTVAKCDVLNIRSGAGTKYARVGQIPKGDKVEIYETTTVSGSSWGRMDQGWVCMYYLQLDDSSTGTSSGGTTASTSVNGTVVNCSAVNIRSAAGTANSKVGTYAKGTQVTILEQTTVKGSTWGRTSKGWVHMYYIKLDTSSGGTSSNTSTDTSTGTSSGTTSSGSSSSGTSQTGTVVKTDVLRIRSAAGVKNALVGQLSGGDRVTILETTKVGTSTWGRIDQGWICMYYVQLDQGSTTSSSGTTRTVTATSLRIRSGAGTSNAVTGSYAKGAQVTILEQTTVSGRPWGRTDKGWICLDYVK